MALCGMLALAGCQAPLRRVVPENQLLAGGRYEVIQDLDVPPAPGPSGCGAQSLAAVMAHCNSALHSAAIADRLPWKDRGATPIAILLTARANGYSARILAGDWQFLRGQIDAKTPVLVMFDRSSQIRLPLIPRKKPSYHWGVVSGMAKDQSRILIAAPDHRHYSIDKDLFIERWNSTDRCTIVVLPGAALSLENAGAEGLPPHESSN